MAGLRDEIETGEGLDVPEALRHAVGFDNRRHEFSFLRYGAADTQRTSEATGM